ncbi:hypothetical protein FACS1894184_15370 [Clostridia bacterium]|nr:hypothetical protein FACS1894184_15370 [Clostridia bacterium]
MTEEFRYVYCLRVSLNSLRLVPERIEKLFVSKVYNPQILRRFNKKETEQKRIFMI